MVIHCLCEIIQYRATTLPPLEMHAAILDVKNSVCMPHVQGPRDITALPDQDPVIVLAASGPEAR